MLGIPQTKMKTNISIFNILKQLGELTTIYLYVGKAIETDPYEKTKEDGLDSVIPIKAVVKDASFSALVYQFYGNIPTGSKEIYAEKKYKNLFKIARKIRIGDENYITWKNSSKGFQIQEKRDYIIVIASLNDSEVRN